MLFVLFYVFSFVMSCIWRKFERSKNSEKKKRKERKKWAKKKKIFWIFRGHDWNSSQPNDLVRESIVQKLTVGVSYYKMWLLGYSLQNMERYPSIMVVIFLAQGLSIGSCTHFFCTPPYSFIFFLLVLQFYSLSSSHC